jgi:hypothetical protein
MPNRKTIKSIVMLVFYFVVVHLILIKPVGMPTWTSIAKPIPRLSKIGQEQAHHLANFLVPHLQNQASHPVRVVTSPMRRTLETIRPTLERLHASNSDENVCQVICNAFYHESEGCHVREKAGTLFRESDCLLLLLLNVCTYSNFSLYIYRGRNESTRNCGIAQGFHQ